MVAYARNHHLDFTIPYEWQGLRHGYRPDYLVRWRCGDGQEVKIILELKGFGAEQDRQKETAARRWVRVVNQARCYRPARVETGESKGNGARLTPGARDGKQPVI